MTSNPASYLNALTEVAADQWGLLTWRHLVRLGVSPATRKRITKDGRYLTNVAAGVYRVEGAPVPDHHELLAAWLQLQPGAFVWERTPEQGVVSHRSAAAVHSIGDLPADQHEFTLPRRKQSRRADVRIHQRNVGAEHVNLRGLLVTTPARTAADLLVDGESPEAVARVITDSLRQGNETVAAFSQNLAPLAARFDFRRHNGAAVLSWLLDMIGDPNRRSWLSDLQASRGGSSD